jgi:DNA polymerase III delta subunit
MDFKSLQKKIKAKEFEPIYVLHGDESFYIDKLVDSICMYNMIILVLVLYISVYSK